MSGASLAEKDTDSSGVKNSTKKIPEPHSSPFYNRLVPTYQAFWPAVARRRIIATIESLSIPPDSKVLEVGVGTGMSLDSYPHNISLTGVDLSEAMLAEAQNLINEKGYQHINVLPMNAENLEFPDSSFDMVMSFHTISVVSDPRKMMSEIVRVCKPGGRILLINHFRSENPLIARVVDSAGNITKRLGWRTDLNIDEVISDLPLRLDDCYKTSKLSLFTVMKATCKPELATA
ncbi:class I SAM-dependent methyltransferase [Rubripirellula amarantea]|uniref:Putative methyltransferase YcgJ n=1 Tax=Rubripirellula amarantea TaxID=2527999 RepID=A0A5C5WNG3_9BACT|nr:class I SAM-dependent methyltransferase [Rubripirellula amarantea]MDA8743343.1 class I SAM-dependent methyltransferase [Rubripirellula amarantea]TWT51362.1 putative methyltransferase YcgJ [Rubripirellula amarantea]